MVMLLLPVTSVIVAVQAVVPVAVPLAPDVVFVQAIWVRVAGATALAVPLTVIGDDVVVDGGAVTVTVGSGGAGGV